MINKIHVGTPNELDIIAPISAPTEYLAKVFTEERVAVLRNILQISGKDEMVIKLKHVCEQKTVK
jgi:hypothetical protein